MKSVFSKDMAKIIKSERRKELKEISKPKLKPSKKIYEDENELVEDFCNQMNCNSCCGTDEAGESNGYGCDEKDKFMEKYEDKVKYK